MPMFDLTLSYHIVRISYVLTSIELATACFKLKNIIGNGQFPQKFKEYEIEET